MRSAPSGQAKQRCHAVIALEEAQIIWMSRLSSR